MDVTGRGWFDDPTIMKGLDNLREVEYKIFDRDWESRSEVAVVISPESSLRERLLSPLPQWYLSVFRQWSLSKMGAPFDSVLMEDVLSGKAWNYKLFVFPNAYYLTDSDRQMLRERLLEQNASALWFHAPGYLSDSGSGIDRSSELTGIALTESARPGVSILFSKAHDPLLRNIKAGDRYGMACDLPDVESKSMTRQCNILDMPDPVVVSDDPDAVNLGNVQGLDMPGLVVKRSGGRADVFSFAPALPWRFMKNLLIEAGAHVWCRTGDIVYADSRFVGVHASTTAVKTIRFPELCRATNLRTGELLGENVSTLKLKMKRGETMLIGTEPV
jgi:hypothetical protein